MITRKDYIDGKATFAEYYGEIAQEAGISYAESSMLPRIKAALAAGDEHLNSIHLNWWDSQGVLVRHILAPLFKERGDCWSLAGSVCVLKAAAIAAAEATDEVS